MIGLGAFLDFMRGKWWIVPVVACLGFALIQWGNARHFEKLSLNRKLQIEQMRREAAEQAMKNERRIAEATAAFAERLGSIQPIVVRSRDTVREYANTPQGNAACLPADRVAGVQRDREALFAGSDSASPEGGARAVPPEPAP